LKRNGSNIADALPISGIGNWGTPKGGWSAGFLRHDQKKPFFHYPMKDSEEKGFNPKDNQKLIKPFGSHFASTPLKGSI
jgi:hypothetical protein